MILHGVLLSLAVGFSLGERFYGKLEVGGPDYVIESPGYPSPAPAYTEMDFSLKAIDTNGKIKLTCTDIQLKEGSPCRGELLYVFNGAKIDELCGKKSGFETVTTSNRLNVKLTTGGSSGGRVKCTAKAIQGEEEPADPWENVLKFQSAEEDSTEWGLGGAKKTTSCPCGDVNKGRIVGGKETKANEYPFLVGLINIEIMFLFCGATIITPKHAITAAHCTFPRKEDKLGILSGYHDISEKIRLGWKQKNMTGVTLVEKTIEHADYNPKNYRNDIALLVLKDVLEYSNVVKPACIPNGKIDLLNKDVRVLGWGRLSTGGPLSDTVQKVTLRVMPLGLCQERFPFVNTDDPKQICTYGHGKDSCTGDSGGPVIWMDPETNRYTLVGLVSFGKKQCASENNPALNTEVASYLDWIGQKIRETSSGLRTCAKIN